MAERQSRSTTWQSLCWAVMLLAGGVVLLTPSWHTQPGVEWIDLVTLTAILFFSNCGRKVFAFRRQPEQPLKPDRPQNSAPLNVWCFGAAATQTHAIVLGLMWPGIAATSWTILSLCGWCLMLWHLRHHIPLTTFPEKDLTATKLEAERRAAEIIEAAKLEAERRAAERIEAARREDPRLVIARRVPLNLEADRIDVEKREAEKAKAAKIQATRLEVAKTEAARILESMSQDAERLEAARLEAERREAERIEITRMPRDDDGTVLNPSYRQEAAKRKAARLETERLEAEKAEAARLEAERIEAERVKAARREAARREAARIETPALEAYRIDNEKRQVEKREAEKAEAAKIQAARREVAKAEVARIEVNRREAARLEAAKSDLAPFESDLDVTAFAPPVVRHGETFLLQIFVHLAEQATRAAELAKEFDAVSEARAATSLLESVTSGTRLEFQLQLRQGKAETTKTVLRWTGQPQSAPFLVTADADPSQTSLFGSVTISRNSVPIGQLSFKVALTTSAVNQPAEPIGMIDPFRQYFISYASKDRSEVIKRVQMLPRLGKAFRQDLLSLDPGDRFERKLYEFIRECDATLLFWSSNAKASKWVLKECLFCIEHKGIERLLPVIIERPPPLPPPELAELHMNDRLLYFVEATKSDLAPSDSDDFVPL